MKWAFCILSLFSMGFFLLNLTACQTESPGATDTLGFYSTNVSGTPDTVTAAAVKSCNDLKLQNVVANSTKVDGKITAKDAQGDDVAIDIIQNGENVSKITIHVGATGDQALSKQLVDKIKSHLSWL